MPRKSKSAKSNTTTSVDTPSAVTAAETPVASRKEPLVTQADVPVKAVGPYEDRRKEMQRMLQKLVLQMRADGNSEADIKFAVTREKRKEERKIQALEEKRANEQKATSHDVIIVPVAWKRNHHEKITVDVTCDNVRRALFSTGLNPWLDCRREYSPGQKFAYWEHMGVKFRIEIGPEDVSQGVCRVVRADTPGAYLEHQREKPELNLQAIVKTLAAMGLSKCQEMNSNLMSEASLVEYSFDQTQEAADHVPEDDVGGNVLIPERSKNVQKKFRRF